MTREDTQKILMVIQAAYPNYRVPDKSVAIDLWHRMVGGYDYQSIMAAVETYIANDESGFAPSPGQVLGKLRVLTQPGHLAPMEAWGLVSKALRNGIYGYLEEYNRLPDEVRRAVGSAEQLHWWAQDEGYNENVAMSNFIKSYKLVCDRSDELAQLPASARELISETLLRLDGD